MGSKTLKVLALHDTPTNGPMWAYSRRTDALQKHAPPDMEITRASHPEAQHWDLRKFDLVLLLDYMVVQQWKARTEQAGIPLVVSMNKDARSRHDDWQTVLSHSDFVIVSNLHRWTADGIQPKTCHITNGVDLEMFRETVPISERPHRCLWTGGTGVKKQKRYAEIIDPLRPLLESRGFTHSFRPITKICASQVFDGPKMVEWYNSGSYWLCASATEGAPSTLHESMACGTIPIMTNVGNAPEIIRHKENGMIVEPTIPAFLDALEYARENRERLSAAARERIAAWGYGPPANHATHFYDLFRRIIGEGTSSIEPFSYLDAENQLQTPV